MSRRFWGLMGVVVSLMIEGEGILAPVASAATVPTVESLTVHKASLNGITKISAYGEDPDGIVEYQFWVENNQGWSMVQNYSPTNTLTLPSSSGSEVVTVYALDRTAVESGQWQRALAQTLIINHNSSVFISSPPTATVGNAVTFKATAQNLIQTVYQYWIQNPQGEWSSSGNYGLSPTWTYTPSRSGTYHIVVYAKDLMAPNDAQDAVWSDQTLTVAPFVPQGYQLSTALANPTLALHQPNALLLGHIAQVEATVRNANGQPVADVPVLFTATNDSNPNDHVSFAQGLNDEAYTNQNGEALADIYVSNPSDPSSSQLAQDTSAVTLVGYSVSLPQDPLVDPVTNTVAYGAYIPPNLTVSGTNSSMTEPIYRNTLVQDTAYLPWQTAGEASHVQVSGQYLLPVVPQNGVVTIPVNYESGAYGPDVTESSTAQGFPVIPIASGFNAAQIELTQLGLSSGSSFTVDFTEVGNSTPEWSKTITGPVHFNDRIMQIPASPVGGQLTFRLQSGPVVNPATATGVSIGSVVVDAGQNPGSEVLPASLPVTWSSVPVSYGPWQSLSPEEAALYLGQGAPSSSYVSYQYKVPAFPEVGNAVLEEMVNGQPQAYYWIPTTNNGANQNVLLSPPAQGSVAMPISPASLTPLLLSTNSHESTWTLSSQQAGQSEIVAQVTPDQNPRPSDTLYSYVGWVPSTPGNNFVSQYALAGQQVVLSATVRDQTGNVVPAAPVNWSVQGGVNVIQQEATTNSQGIATITLSAADAKTAVVEASSPGEQVALSDLPDQVPFTAAKIHFVSWHWHEMAIPSLSFAVGSTHEIGIMAEGLTASNYAVSLSNMDFTLSQSGVGNARILSNTANSPVGIIRLSSDQAGNQDISVSPAAIEPELMIDGQQDVGQGPISGIAPAAITVNFMTNGGNLSLHVPSSLSAIGTVVPIDVTVTDPFGNPIVGQPVSFSLWPSSGGTAVVSSTQGVTNAQGLAQVFLSGGSVGEVDEVGASLAGQSPQTTLVQWQNSTGAQMALVNAEIGGSTTPNTLMLTMSRQVNPHTVLANGSQFQLEDMSTGQMYQIAHATASGNTVTLTLDSSNPVLNFNNQIYQVSVAPVTSDGVTSAVMDEQNQAAQNAVTLLTPSSPSITASISSGTLTIALGNGQGDIPQGLSVSVAPSNAQASINNGIPGAVYQSTTSASTTNTETISVPISGPAGTIYTIYFDGISGTCS
ncbi:Ig-like domain-containing protein [Sulfobacillus thermosulfidooxidans]|uniref:Ig-like domain-containing protein n=1 Tax=Sulfobacillus thermosulfidooxidans TaxID=28034 RepID=UPI00096BB97A|nr:Ig-like domain-containing protein [Sulfobacillus thermosulfidooxidans]OLZ12004.1 hypothetical protein BFX05_05900 [Sulfobacillus thermosulfidooxidans]OLZ16744.1 hypothetical protein BFX06_14695 [Sulfobacillus thermosulfidooxidans]OLZ20707.1 hypothetical protein BFX07_14585 [Sulfobacillus thermosulfidooxidans]